MSHSDCVRIATGIVSGKHRAVIRIVEIKRAAKRLRKAIKQKAPSTFVQYASIVAKHTAMASPVPDQLVAAVLMDKLCSAIYRYTSKHTTCVFGTYDVTVATWLTMLSVGVRSGDVQIVPCVPQLQRMMPPESLMALLPRINCRAISVARRKFLKYVYTTSGMPRFNRIFAI
jgi:hypothetical protein